MEQGKEQGKLGTLTDMTKESFENRPEQAPEAIEEYLNNIDSDKAQALKEKLEDSVYLENFKTAITHTSLMVFLAAFKATQSNPSVNVDFNQYTREFLFYAREDDKNIYDMRVFYLSNLDAEEMGIGETEDASDKDEQATDLAKSNYNSYIKSLLAKYTETKIHISQ